MNKPLNAREIARRRVITRFECSGSKTQRGKGEIVLAGRLFRLDFDDVLDLAQSMEMISLRLTGKVLRPQFRPEIKDRAALALTRIVGGDYSAYEGKAPISNYTICEVTDQVVRTSYLRIEIEGNVWENWFARLDELLKCLYIVIREAQGDPYVPPAREVVRQHVMPAGHA